MQRMRFAICTLPFARCVLLLALGPWPFAVGADRGRELFFKTFDPGPAGQPPRAQSSYDFIHFCFLKRGTKEWNLNFGHKDLIEINPGCSSARGLSYSEAPRPKHRASRSWPCNE